MKEAIILYSCNQWKEYSSLRVIGVFTNRNKFNSCVKKHIKAKEMNWNLRQSIEDSDLKEIQASLEYGDVEIVELNKEVE